MRTPITTRAIVWVTIVAVVLTTAFGTSLSPTYAGGETPTPVVGGNDGGNGNGPAPSEQTPAPADTAVPPSPTEVASTAVPATPVVLDNGPTTTPVVVEAPSVTPSKTQQVMRSASHPATNGWVACRDGQVWIHVRVHNTEPTDGTGTSLTFSVSASEFGYGESGSLGPQEIFEKEVPLGPRNIIGGVVKVIIQKDKEYDQSFGYGADNTCVEPTASPTNTSVPPTETDVPPSATPSATNTPQPSNTPTVTPSNTPLPSATPTYTATATYTASVVPSNTPLPPTATYTFTPSSTPMATNTQPPPVVEVQPSVVPPSRPTVQPTQQVVNPQGQPDLVRLMTNWAMTQYRRLMVIQGGSSLLSESMELSKARPLGVTFQMGKLVLPMENIEPNGKRVLNPRINAVGCWLRACVVHNDFVRQLQNVQKGQLVRMGTTWYTVSNIAEINAHEVILAQALDDNWHILTCKTYDGKGKGLDMTLEQVNPTLQFILNWLSPNSL